jgi:hypothetical protein
MSDAINSHWSSCQSFPELADVQQSLFRSLNRASRTENDSGASGDAARIADSARRLGANQTRSEPVSGLSLPRALLHETAQTLRRMGELKSRYDDPATSDPDRAVYAEEFGRMQFDLFESTTRRADGPKGKPLLFEDHESGEVTGRLQFDEETPGSTGSRVSVATVFTDDFSNADNWVSRHGSVAVSDNTLLPNAGGRFGAVESKKQFSGAFELTFDLDLSGAVASLDICLGGATLSHLADPENATKWGWHSVRIAYDGAGHAATYLNGSDTAADTQSGFEPAVGALSLANYGEGSARIRNFSLVGSATPDAAVPPSDETSTQLSAVMAATDLASLDPATLDGALAEVAVEEATNAAVLGDVDWAALLSS